MSYAQVQYQDVVYLKNGSVIQGTVVEQIPNQSIKIQTADGNLFVYRIEEILKITKEPVQVSKVYIEKIGKPVSPLSNAEFLINPLGILQFGPIINFGPRVGSHSYLCGHIRWAGMGLLSHLIADGELAIGSMAVGVKYRVKSLHYTLTRSW